MEWSQRSYAGWMEFVLAQELEQFIALYGRHPTDEEIRNILCPAFVGRVEQLRALKPGYVDMLKHIHEEMLAAGK